MLGVELIIFRRCLLLVLIVVGGIHSVIAQQMHAFYNSVPEFHGVYRWLDPFFPLNPQVDRGNLNVIHEDDTENHDKTISATDEKRFKGRVSDQVYEGSEVISSPAKSVENITYSSSSSTTRYRAAIDRRIDEQYLGKPVFVDARGVKYIIDSKYRKQIVE
ncbi:hypothetical protein [Sphingobacterium sp. 2149]|uniref:hypothetical protein n=1 Tax=Sphingobacterium sp. 2149 TaxID=2817763 RepID=UPI002856A0F9|nr:hypothetical protein [Sphingobacterium sp. 2149]MDR6737290.1 hypothetical protein [Sphingobacterium sp. 2149]